MEKNTDNFRRDMDIAAHQANARRVHDDVPDGRRGGGLRSQKKPENNVPTNGGYVDIVKLLGWNDGVIAACHRDRFCACRRLGGQHSRHQNNRRNNPTQIRSERRIHGNMNLPFLESDKRE